jgi:hypothetical protein
LGFLHVSSNTYTPSHRDSERLTTSTVVEVETGTVVNETVVNDVDEATVDSIGTSVVGEPSSTDSHAARTIIKQTTGAAHRRPISVSDPDSVSVV